MFEIMLLILIGAGLIFLETVLVGGIWCVAGLALCLWGVWLSYVGFGAFAAVFALAFSFAACVGAFLFWLYVLPKTRFGKKIYLSSAQDGKAPSADFKALVGRRGRTVSKLMPTGKVELGGVLYDARAELNHLESGVEVEVVSADSFSVVVRRV